MILDFKDQFSRYPDQLPEVNATVESIERIREVSANVAALIFYFHCYS